MTCPICDQKPMNCDCTPRERTMWREMQERGDAPQTPSLTDAEREAISIAMHSCDIHEYRVLRDLLARMPTHHAKENQA